MSTFTLTIKLGNAAMQTPGDVARALRDQADRLQPFDDDAAGWDAPIKSSIWDSNGNGVGQWEVAK